MDDEHHCPPYNPPCFAHRSKDVSKMAGKMGLPSNLLATGIVMHSLSDADCSFA
jgi:hypothetical protein